MKKTGKDFGRWFVIIGIGNFITIVMLVIGGFLLFKIFGENDNNLAYRVTELLVVVAAGAIGGFAVGYFARRLRALCGLLATAGVSALMLSETLRDPRMIMIVYAIAIPLTGSIFGLIGGMFSSKTRRI